MAPDDSECVRVRPGAPRVPIARVREFYRIARRRWGFVRDQGRVFACQAGAGPSRRFSLLIWGGGLFLLGSGFGLLLVFWPFLALLVVY